MQFQTNILAFDLCSILRAFIFVIKSLSKKYILKKIKPDKVHYSNYRFKELRYKTRVDVISMLKKDFKVKLCFFISYSLVNFKRYIDKNPDERNLD